MREAPNAHWLQKDQGWWLLLAQVIKNYGGQNFLKYGWA